MHKSFSSLASIYHCDVPFNLLQTDDITCNVPVTHEAFLENFLNSSIFSLLRDSFSYGE